MPRIKRPVIAVNVESGEQNYYESVYACAKAINSHPSNILPIINSAKTSNGYRIIDADKNAIQRQIEELKKLVAK